MTEILIQYLLYQISFIKTGYFERKHTLNLKLILNKNYSVTLGIDIY